MIGYSGKKCEKTFNALLSPVKYVTLHVICFLTPTQKWER